MPAAQEARSPRKPPAARCGIQGIPKQKYHRRHLSGPRIKCGVTCRDSPTPGHSAPDAESREYPGEEYHRRHLSGPRIKCGVTRRDSPTSRYASAQTSFPHTPLSVILLSVFSHRLDGFVYTRLLSIGYLVAARYDVGGHSSLRYGVYTFCCILCSLFQDSIEESIK